METLTVRETLMFAADMKFKGDQRQRNAKVDEILKTL